MKIKTLVVVFGWLLFANMLQAQDWLRWRGEAGQNHARPLPSPLKGQVELAWEAQVGMGHATVVVHGDMVFTLGNKVKIEGRDTTQQDVVVCLDAATGKTLWEYAYACPAGSWEGPRATPLWDQGRLYTLGRGGQLFCLDADKGQAIWKRHLVEEGFSKVPRWGFSGSPVTDGNTLYINAGRSGTALDKHTGRTIWKSAPEEAGLGTPILFTHQGNRRLALMGKGMLYVMEAATGRVLWTRKKNDECYTDPLIIGNDMLLTNYRGGSERLRLTDGEPEVLWAQPETKTGSWQTLTLCGRYGYAPMSQDDPPFFQCVDVETGLVKWTEPLGWYGALTVAGNDLVIVTGDGELIIAPATDQGLKPVLRKRFVQLPAFNPPTRQYHVIWSHPVWAGGRLYVRSNHGRLFCLTIQ